jgi:hypothetical protein
MSTQKSFTTPKGTELPLMNLKGKPYLQVAHRIVWFREEEPNSTIETIALTVTEEGAVFQAKIIRDGKLIAMATKRETKKDFPDFIEKAETGAIGRALALVGYGTQFTTQDLDEGDRLADSPVTPATKAAKVKDAPPPVDAPVEAKAVAAPAAPAKAPAATGPKSSPFFNPNKAKPAVNGNGSASQYD